MTTFSISLQPQPGYSGHEFCATIPCISQLLHDPGLDVPEQDDNIGWPVAVQPFLSHNRNPATGQEFSLFGRVRGWPSETNKYVQALLREGSWQLDLPASL